MSHRQSPEQTHGWGPNPGCVADGRRVSIEQADKDFADKPRGQKAPFTSSLRKANSSFKRID
jgi:hypothetical protein